MKKLIIFAFILTGLTMGCKKQDPGTPGENEIFLEYKTFNPTQKSIAKGTTITFINKDNADHTATSTKGTFDSGRIRSGESFSYTFNDAGIFYFYCNYHSNSSAEQGAILVQ
ncbi:MAG TPA: cupredoxin domain-containing protein [Bacteroidia bacterium]|nr:cupredoxin domain-containing protein [Bacteroidia bacterium]